MRKQKQSERTVVGLTGSFGSGKSTVASMLESSGAAVIDADRLVHDLMRPGTAAWKQIRKEFGAGILKSDASIDRRRLGMMVFGRKKLLARLNAIIHPKVVRAIRASLQKIRKKVVIVDAPLLFEAGLEKDMDLVVVVAASRANQIRRIQKKSSLTRSAILKRIRSQMPLRRKLARADFVIDNNGTIEETKKQVARIRRLLWRS